jgi:hypothetical protein
MAVTLQVDLFSNMPCQRNREYYSRKVSAFESACTLDWTPFSVPFLVLGLHSFAGVFDEHCWLLHVLVEPEIYNK